jgi:chloramphenicol O-acetyltransferase type A
MPEYLDIESWTRRDLFEFFRGYEKPHFNICTRVDVTNLLNFLRDRTGVSVSSAYLYFALRLANEIEPFRYRLKEGKVLVHDVIHGGTTVMLPNESFSYAYFDYHEDFEKFSQGAAQSIKKVQSEGLLKPTMRDDLIYFTVLPWVSFTSFAHARTPGRGESVPRIAFGKFINESERTMLPISVEVHHALMDGLHVGRYLNRLEEALREPELYISDKSVPEPGAVAMGSDSPA